MREYGGLRCFGYSSEVLMRNGKQLFKIRRQMIICVVLVAQVLMIFAVAKAKRWERFTHHSLQQLNQNYA